MSRGMLVAGNWKMNLDRREAIALAGALAGVAKPSSPVEVGIFPPFPWIVPVRDIVANLHIAVGAQNCHTDVSGAFTGEVSAAMLADVCDYILAGHSERRHIFGESDETVGAKVAAILATSPRPILCVGELLNERNAGRAEEVVARQLDAGLASVAQEDVERLTIAYEPVWAIGTGVAATPDDAQAMCAFVRSWLIERFGISGGDLRILYGGSVSPDNAATLFGQADVDGALVGGASLKADSFRAIVAAANA
ncbi:MAG TPA: triose-phosphate isomerase [Thermomicrobiales bacterium]|nr:triose-phosphate isomerase [Thermomicrobiales bacterium]